jgi:hypothetical protein
MTFDPAQLDRIEQSLAVLAAALTRMAPPAVAAPDFAAAEAFVWQSQPEAFIPVPHVSRQPLQLLVGIERVADQLLENTNRFANGFPANNALLWGARGMGKSSLVKAIHASINDVKYTKLSIYHMKFTFQK